MKKPTAKLHNQIACVLYHAAKLLDQRAETNSHKAILDLPQALAIIPAEKDQCQAANVVSHMATLYCQLAIEPLPIAKEASPFACVLTPMDVL